MIVKFTEGNRHVLINLDNVATIKAKSHGMGIPVDPAKGLTTFKMVNGSEVDVEESFNQVAERLGC